MIVQSKYTKKFVSDSLTREKYNELYSFAVYLRDCKNELSQFVRENLIDYLDMNKFAFVTKMRERFQNKIPSSFDKHVYQQVIDAYQNKFDAIQKKLKFEVIVSKGFDFYKRKTKQHEKGDFKKVVVEKKDTPLSNCLTYLARYGNENILDYIRTQLDRCDGEKQKFYNNILECCEKYGFERLYSLALSKRERIVKHYSERPVTFKSLTFSGRCRKKSIVNYNKNRKSIISTFISLSWDNRKSMDIPVKYSKAYHGKITDYLKNSNNYEYTITFNEQQHQVNIHLCKNGDRYMPQATGKIIGIDVNCKHNLFSLSDETIFDYDRKLVNDFCKLSLEIDKLKKQDKNYKVGKRKQRKLNALKGKMSDSEDRLISNMCKTLQKQGVGHIVMEDLDNSFGRCYVKDKDNEDINYNRKVKFLGLSSLKDKVEHIARKYDIAVSTVQASYTSKMCPVCGCIEDENRSSQEEFECIECGHKDNADFNAAKNIRNRVVVTVLQQKLLKQGDNGSFKPRKLKREKVKEVLLSYRTSLLQTGRECKKDFNFS